MKKMYLFLGILLLSVTWFVTGCGIPQEDYDDILTQLNKVQQELKTVKSDLENSQNNVSDLTANQEKLNSELTATQTELSEMNAEYEKNNDLLETTNIELMTTQDKLEEAQNELIIFQDDLKTDCGPLLGFLSLNDALNDLVIAILNNDKEEIPALAATVDANIAPNAMRIKSLWEEAYVLEGTIWKLTYAPLAEMIKVVNEGIQYGANLLGQRIY